MLTASSAQNPWVTGVFLKESATVLSEFSFFSFLSSDSHSVSLNIGSFIWLGSEGINTVSNSNSGLCSIVFKCHGERSTCGYSGNYPAKPANTYCTSSTGDGSPYRQETVRHTKGKQYLTPKESSAKTCAPQNQTAALPWETLKLD